MSIAPIAKITAGLRLFSNKLSNRRFFISALVSKT